MKAGGKQAVQYGLPVSFPKKGSKRGVGNE